MRVSRGRLIVALARLVALGLRIRRPEREVVAQQLHDQCTVLIRVFVERVEFGNRVVERLQQSVYAKLDIFVQKSTPAWRDCMLDQERSISRSRIR